jgi:hypothetical protein
MMLPPKPARNSPLNPASERSPIPPRTMMAIHTTPKKVNTRPRQPTALTFWSAIDAHSNIKLG